MKILCCTLIILICSCSSILDKNEDYWTHDFKLEEGKTYTYTKPLRFSEDVVIPKYSTIRLLNSAYIYTWAKLIFEEGVTVEFAESSNIEIEKLGKIYAYGTADSPVTFKSAESGSLPWGGIIIKGSSDTANYFQNVVIKNAVIGISCDKENGLSIKNSSIKGCEKYGLRLGDKSLKNLEDCELSGNGISDINSGSYNIANVQHNNTLEKGIKFSEYCEEGNLVFPITKYIVSKELFLTGSTAIQEGTRFSFQQDALLKTATSCRLNVSGSENKPVLFKPEEKVLWGGLLFSTNHIVDSSEHAHNTINHAIIDSARIGINLNNSSLELKNSQIKNFDSCAVFLDKNTILTETDNSGFDSTDIIKSVW